MFFRGCIFSVFHIQLTNMTHRISTTLWMLICCGSTVFFLPSDRKEQLWMELKAGAESGWHFTSRWYVDRDGHNNGTLGDTRTSQILPTDLNALLCLTEKTLASFHRILGKYLSII